MTSLGDKAKEAAEHFQTVANIALRQPYRIRQSELEDAEDLGDSSFPRHGEWLVTDAGSDRQLWYLECPGGLAQALVEELESRGLEAEDAEGYWFAIVDRRQEHEDAPWQFELELAPKDVETREQADDWAPDRPNEEAGR